MDQLEITVYAKAWSLPCWRTKRLLRRKGYAFRVISAAADDGPRARLPAVFVDGRLVGDFGDIKLLERTAELDRLVRGEV